MQHDAPCPLVKAVAKDSVSVLSSRHWLLFFFRAGDCTQGLHTLGRGSATEHTPTPGFNNSTAKHSSHSASTLQIFKILCCYFMCLVLLPASTSVDHKLEGLADARWCQIPGTGVTEGCELPSGVLGIEFRPLEKQP